MSRDQYSVLSNHLLPADVPHVYRLEVEVLGPVRLQTAVVAAGRVGHGGAARGRHLPPGHTAGRGLACPRVVRRVSVLQPEMGNSYYDFEKNARKHLYRNFSYLF